RIRFEDFSRDQRVGLIVVSDGVLDFATGTSQEDAKSIFAASAGSGTHQVRSSSGDSYYVASASFTPWDWLILLAKDATAFDALVRKVQALYGGSAIVLLAIAGLLVVGLRQILVRPIYRIAQEFGSGHAPTYRGVKELEHLSHSIGDMLRSLK